MFKLFKHRNPFVYIFLGIYLTLIAVIITESCLSSSVTGSQSNLIAQIMAIFVNEKAGPQSVEVLKPIEISNIKDSSYLGKDENDISLIAEGTTTLLSIDIQYPEKKNQDDEYDKNYVINRDNENKDDYQLVLASSLNKNIYTINIRIVAGAPLEETQIFNIQVSDNIEYEYKFKIVELAKPGENDYEAKLDKTTLKIGETTQINTKLVGDSRTDAYLRRYFDITKIEHSSSNESVATIDQYGVIRAIGNGYAVINYGKYQFDINVTNESMIIPATNVLSLDATKTTISTLDYDYVFDQEDASLYSAIIYPHFSNDELIDKGVTYILEDNDLNAKIAPFKYDEEGYPIYQDDEGKDCVRVCGYRKKGEVTLTAIANYDSTITESIVLTIGAAQPVEMKLNISDAKMILDTQKIISATFTPINTQNTALNVTCNDEEAFRISNNNSSSITIIANKVGNFTLTISSVANPDIKQTINIEIEAKQLINDLNFDDFHSFIRKFAGHLSLFLVTAIFGFLFFYTFFKEEKHKYIFGLPITLLLGFMVAGISEWIQYYVPTRSGLFSDVLIDFLGYSVGTILSLLIYLIIYFIIRYIVKKKNSKEN